MSDLSKLPLGILSDRLHGLMAIVIDSFEEACDIAAGWPASDGFHKDMMAVACRTWPEEEEEGGRSASTPS